MEIEQYLQELFDSSASHEDLQRDYFGLVASKTQESLLSFDGIKLLPPLLSKADKQAMRDYRRKAMSLEQKLFEAQRQKYSNLLLQVMELTDKFQVERDVKTDNKTAKPKQQQPQPQTYQSMTMEDLLLETLTTSESRPINTTNKSHNKADQSLVISSKNNNSTKDEARWADHQTFKDDNHYDDSLVPIFQKPKLYNSSSSPGNNKSKTISASLHSEVPSSMSMNEAGTTRSSSLGRESIMSSSSTLKGSHQSLPREALESRQDLNPSDSLASTVLSMAFTESSFASEQSTLVGQQQSLKSAQRQLDMDSINHNLYKSYYHTVNPLTSMPTDHQQTRMAPQKVTTKKTASSSSTTSSHRTGASSSKNNTKSITEQDKALEKLELMKKKLLEEKEKQLILLRKQELSRLRQLKEKPDYLVSNEHYEEVIMGVYSPVHIGSRPASDMYSIPERSFEGTASFSQADQTEIESASDKENNACNGNLQQIAHQCNDYDNELVYGNQVLDSRHEVEPENYPGDIESRPISVQSKKGANKERRRSSLYVRQEFQKQFEIEMSNRNDGKDKFSILTAYVKGFMTRRVLQTDKVQAIVKTIKDTSEFLADISKEGTTSYQDKTLQQRVQTQLVAAKSKLHDIFFTIPISERMAYMEHSRNAAREREDRMNAKSATTSQQLTRKLSAATMKAMQRRQDETNNNSDVKNTSAGSQLGKRRSVDTRALKPVQSTKSPQVPDKGRLQVKRRSLASPVGRRSLGKKSYNSRTATAVGTRPISRKSITRTSAEETAEKPTRTSRTSLDGKSQITKRTKPISNTESNPSKLPVKKGLEGGLTYRVSKLEDSHKVLVPKSRPSTAMARSRQPVIGQPRQPVVESRPKTAIGARRVTRSMAAKFINKQ